MPYFKLNANLRWLYLISSCDCYTQQLWTGLNIVDWWIFPISVLVVLMVVFLRRMVWYTFLLLMIDLDRDIQWALFSSLQFQIFTLQVTSLSLSLWFIICLYLQYRIYACVHAPFNGFCCLLTFTFFRKIHL